MAGGVVETPVDHTEWETSLLCAEDLCTMSDTSACCLDKGREQCPLFGGQRFYVYTEQRNGLDKTDAVRYSTGYRERNGSERREDAWFRLRLVWVVKTSVFTHMRTTGRISPFAFWRCGPQQTGYL